jgi:hypothetical protein
MARGGDYLKKIRGLVVIFVNNAIQDNLPKAAAIIMPPLRMVNAKSATLLTVRLIRDY